MFTESKNEVLYVAVDDHAAQSDDDLMFLKGELITVTRRLNEIMWEVSPLFSFHLFFVLFFGEKTNRSMRSSRASVKESVVFFLPSW